MSAPVPAPRTVHLISEGKKPVPKPRTAIPIARNKSDESSGSSKNSEENEHANTFSRRMKTASKQIAGDIGDMVHERKKAVIEGTRQSVRKITRRFTIHSQEVNVGEGERSGDGDTRGGKEEEAINVFSSIQFQSPIKQREEQGIYNNVSVDSDLSASSDDLVSLPPPMYPPPPLREESIYDAPQSVISSSTGSSSGRSPVALRNADAYESVFPSYPYQSESDSATDSAEKQTDLSRSASWKFYDPVSRAESVYSNVDSTAPIQPINVNSDGNSISSGSFVRQNSLYENHVLEKKRPATSVLLQFDPLNNNASSYENVILDDDKKILEELLQGELYGNLSNTGTYDNWSLSNDSEPGEFVNPPPPPTRVDSLPSDEPPTPTTKEEKSQTSWFTHDNNVVPTSPSSRPVSTMSEAAKKPSWFKQMNEVLKKAPEVVRNLRSKDNMLLRPSLEPKGLVQHKGMLYKVQSGPVEDLFGEFSARWCVLENWHLVCYSDNTCDSVKEHFPMESILSIQILQDQKYKYRYENDELYCFELNTGKNRGGHVYGSRSISERRIWMQRIAETLTHRFSAKITTDYTRFGWAYIREGVSGQWVGAWIVLSHRTLYYAIDNSPVKSLDLRKARFIGLQVHRENENIPPTNDKGPNILVDCSVGGALYLRMWTARESKVWCHIVRLAAHNNGANLDQQQLTKNDVPVIVEKSLNYIYAYGSMTEGIYRRAGSGTAVSELLAQFRKDAWAIQLTDKYSEHDVATALKRFFRDLPEPLLVSSKRQYLYQVSLLKTQDEKVRMYKAAFDTFPPVAQKTAKRLFGHLHFISTQSAKNRMTADNLAAVWAPTLMHYEERDNQQSLDPQKSGVIVSQLITLYKYIFPEDPTESEQERLMLQVLERCMRSGQGAKNTNVSGDFRVWVYLYNTEGETFNIAIGPQKTAYDVCVELSSKIKLEVHELTLEEHVLGGKLVRPLHHTEKVLDVVLRWGYWDEADRRENCLVLSPLSKYWEYIQDKALPVSGELKFADSKMKNFKPFTFEFSQAKLSYYKDKTCSTKLGSWNVEDIIWYLGNETKRNPTFKWTVTFIETKVHPKRTKSTPYFGNCIMWADPSLRATWLAAMLRARYPKGIVPPPQHVNLMLT